MRTVPVAPRRAVPKQRGVPGRVGRGIGWLLVFLAVLALLAADSGVARSPEWGAAQEA